ncbi:hypothetical protein J7W19_20625 [Streptomyces mobaraensis NBRC 13819 = DSM 40847]|nr:hypothetical protein [Streptomyces mobaraensis]QTT75458.1 hypothetical protein J7W19_20625 [Streptomyces mobaraensis NBRC 13819 = DSM 40847]
MTGGTRRSARKGTRALRLALAGGALVTPMAPAAAAPAGTGSAGPPAAYRTAPDAQEIHGALTTTATPPLVPSGRTATDTIAPGERKFYAVRLDGTSDAYVSAVAAPRPGGTPGLRDGIDVSLRRADGIPCGPSRHRSFLAEGGAYPLADHAERLAGTGGPCAAAGTYHFVVARGDADGGDSTPVALELTAVTHHPPVTPNFTAPPGTWASEPPSEPAGPAKGITGGRGFNDAADVRTGTWKDTIRPGETRFYRTPVTTGHQLFAKATFGDAPGHVPYVANGVRMGLNDAARGHVTNRTDGYQGRAVTVPLAAPPPGRDTGPEGWYYLQVSLNGKAGQGRSEAVPITLVVTTAPARSAPTGPPGPRTHRAPDGAALRTAAASPEPDGRLKAVGYAGVGTGTALLLGLGGWYLAARRPEPRRPEPRRPVV